MDAIAFAGRRKRWFRHFREMGFRVIAPNSFAERRPPQQCGNETRKLSPLEHARLRPRGSRIMRLRAAQTHRTLRNMRARYPELPIIVWGQSEGGLVAQLISANADGVISTGAECGIKSARDVLVDEDVPLLVLIGGDDPYIQYPKKKTRQSVKDYCNPILRSARWNHVYLPGAKHFVPFENRTARQAIDRFVAEVLKRSATRRAR